tara:strand:+ start:175 stop:564 length:390 start_codon:yes stop_codon:yes gene_type:complete
MKVSKNPKNYDLITDRDKNIADGNLSIVTDFTSRPKARLWYQGFMKKSVVFSLESMLWTARHFRTMNPESFKKIEEGLQLWISENPLKSQTSSNKSNKVVKEINGEMCLVDLTTGKYSPLVKETLKASK